MAGFTPWTATSVTSALITTTQAAVPTLTDWSVGGVLRSVDEAFAITAQDLAQQVVAARDDATQRGLQRWLGLQPQPAVAAYGAVTFTLPAAASASATLPSGFTVGVPQTALTFTTGAPMAWASGTTTLDAVVTAVTSGTAGNVPANTITQIVSTVPTALAGLMVTNPAPFTTGAPAQSLEDATAQVPAALARLKTGTANAIVATALQATVTNPNGHVIEAVSRAVDAQGGYVPAPTGAPTVAAISGTTALAAGTYGVAYAWATASGVTTASPTGAVTLTSGQAIQVTLPPFPGPGALDPSPAASSAVLYATAAGGSALASAATATGTTATITAAATGSAPASANTAWAGTPGFTTVWVANDLATAPSSGLLAAVGSGVTGYTPASGAPVPGPLGAGILLAVTPAVLVPTDVTLAVLLEPGYTLAMVSTDVTLAIQTVFAGLDIGQTLSPSTQILAVTALAGVGDVALTTPSATIGGARGTLLTVGTITLTTLS